MKVLVVKMTSLGDIIHTLPALTDASAIIDNLQFDWVVEQPFAEIPAWHPRVARVIPVAIRRWRQQPVQAFTSGEWQYFYANLRATEYDVVIDAQGLLKSALVTRLARGKRAGLDYQSASESLASLFYQHRYPVPSQQHAVTRIRQLFAAALNYPLPLTCPDYGLDITGLPRPVYQHYIVFLHGTTWSTKHWPEEYWQRLAEKLAKAGYQILLPWGNEIERLRAERIVNGIAAGIVLPKLSLLEIAGILAQAKAVVAVDTGLGHLAAALNVPTVNIYGPTNPILTGTVGAYQIHLSAEFSCAPCLQRQCSYQGAANVQPACFAQLLPDKVWLALKKIL